MRKKLQRYGATTMFALLLSVASAIGQNLTVSGRVVDKLTKEPIIGATVVDKSGSKGTTTNIDGEFTLSVNSGEQLFVDYMGYERSVVIANNDKNLEIKLAESTELLDEVVVVGYGKVSRKDVTSSITTVSADDMNVGAYSNAMDALQSRVPGLTITSSSDPNSDPSIILRGASTLRSGAAQQPFYVIDGVPGASISLISPNDIESMDVLRDASATSIYGSKAANGVIIINTKRGKVGSTSINYSGYVAVDKVAKNYDMMNAAQWRAYMEEAGKTIFSVDDLGADTDWQQEVQRLGVSQNHNVSISGGSNSTSYNASVNYFDNEGVVKGTDKERISARSFLETKAMNDKLTLAFNLNLSHTNQNNAPSGPNGVYDAMSYYLPISTIYDKDGDFFENPEKSQYYNPVALVEENINNTVTKQMMGNVKLNYEIIKGLNYTLSGSYENDQISNNQYNYSGSMLAVGMDGKAVRSSYENRNKVLETYINFDRTFADRHKVSLMAGYSWEEGSNGDGFQVTAYSFDGDDLTYNNLGAASSVDMNGFGATYLSTLRIISFFGRANYSFDNKYLLQASVRRDGSSAFGVNNRWATFPSVSAAWRLSEEDFIKDLDIFYDLKLRAGYGASGNSLGFDVFTATELYGTNGWYQNSNGDIVHSLGAIRNANPDLKWEHTDMFNVGLDFGFFGGRLGGTIEYYNKETKDLINTVSVSTTEYIYDTLVTNVGSVNNSGVELSIYATPIANDNFRWNTSLNLSHNKNEVVELSNSEFTVDYMDTANLSGLGQSGAYQQRIMEGYAIGTFYTWEWAGYNEDGVSTYYTHDPETSERTGETTTTPTDTDRAVTGCAQPKLTLGWSNNFNYKRLSLGLQFQGVFGNDVMNASRAHLSNVGMLETRNVLASTSETERVADINAHFLSDRYIENGSYFRLSSLNLGYDFGAVSKSIKNLNVYLTCNNVFTISGYSGLDAEVNLGGITPGIDNRSTYPDTRTFMFGANISF